MGREWRTGYDEAIEALQWGNPQPTARPRLTLLNHSFTLDALIGFESKTEAERFWKELEERMAKFSLELHPEKTRLLEFGRHAADNRKRRGEGKPETFNFLGFTHICGTTQKGRFAVIRHTIRKRWQAKLQEVKTELRERMHDPIPEVGAWLRSVMGGHIRYYGVPGNRYALANFRFAVGTYWHRILERRSQNGRVHWENRMKRLIKRWLPPAHIYHPYPSLRLRVTT
jgi:RNA-directed DNA polymerase